MPRARRDLLLALAVAMAVFALLRFRLEGEADLGWHLAQGRLLCAGTWLHTNGLAWTAASTPWVDTSWLFDVMTYLSTRLFPGLLGPKLVIALFFAVTLFFLGLACAELSPLAVWLVPAVALLLLPRATPRPHVASWASLACVLWLCLRARKLDDSNSLVSQRSARRLRLLALFPLWLGAQLHAGAAFSAAPLGLFSLEALLRTRARISLLPALLAPAMLVLGPAGPASIIHLLRHWNLDEVVQILEFQRWTPRSEPYLPPLVLAALFPLLFAKEPGDATAPPKLRSPRFAFLRRPPEQLALLASVLLFTFLALRTVRVFYELVVVCTPPLALLVEQLELRQGRRTAALALAFTFALCLLPHGIPDQLAAPQFDPRWNEQLLPVRAARFLDAHHIDGPGFNGLRDGGYLAWARPSVPVFLDARIHAYPAELWHQLEAAEKSSAQFDRFLRERGAVWALTERERERLSGYRLLDDQPGWALVYWDDTSAIFLRRDQPQLAARIESLEYKRVHPWGNLLGEIGRLDRQQLGEVDRELLRFLHTTPGDAWALSMACASKAREGDPGTAQLCELAARAASREGNGQLLQLVRALQAK